MRRARTFVLSSLGLLAAGLPASAESLPLASLKLPPGFRIEVWAEAPGARSLCLGPDGIVFVGARGHGEVRAVVDDDRDGAPDRVVTVAEGLQVPNGVAFKDSLLYIAEIDRILTVDLSSGIDRPPAPRVFFDGYPDRMHHGWKFIRFGPDGFLYVPVGAPCNVCEGPGDVFATITRIEPGGGGMEIFARGVRNTVGFDWHPATRELWFTDNGRDMMGDDIPSDELNRAARPGLHFGFPYCHAGGIPDPDHGAGKDCADFVPPAVELGAHVAALGMRFYTGAMFPGDYDGRILIAEHGSWNRTVPTGYRVVSVALDEEGSVVESVPFISGWLGPGGAWGRPVDVEILPDGSLLVSDDHAGVIYRVVYEEPAPSEGG